VSKSAKLLESAAWVETVHDLLMRDTLLCLEEWKAHEGRAAEGALVFVDGELDRFQFWFRALVRSFSAQVEGTCFYLRKAAAEAYDRGRLTSLPAELRPVLLEEDPDDPSKKRYNKFLRNVELGFEWFAAAFGKSFRLPKDNHRWVNFRGLIGVRNRITHPEKLEDFTSTAEHIIPVEQGILHLHPALHRRRLLPFSRPERTLVRSNMSGRMSRSRATWARLWPPSVTIRTASSLNSRLKLLRVAPIDTSQPIIGLDSVSAKLGKVHPLKGGSTGAVTVLTGWRPEVGHPGPEQQFLWIRPMPLRMEACG
jgi:hypothetical protein